MIVGSEIGSAYPIFKPIMAGSVFGEIASKAVPSAQKIVDTDDSRRNFWECTERRQP